ncbi:MAG: hypothetical protein KA035_00350 [Candidatus Levybacteria bacterium]|nr:hypothetical protein [Candidatus Levybacteria bacterium]
MKKKGGFIMTCPKCNEEAIIPIRFKMTGKKAYLCENCETVWFEGEEIKVETGRLLEANADMPHTYTFERLVPEIKQIEEAPLAEESSEESSANTLMKGVE